jgi:hypothetical protein
MKEINFEITEHIGVLSEGSNGWRMELNKVSWNGNEPKYDVRDWTPDHTRMSKGVTFSDDELRALKELLDKEVS